MKTQALYREDSNSMLFSLDFHTLHSLPSSTPANYSSENLKTLPTAASGRATAGGCPELPSDSEHGINSTSYANIFLSRA